MLKPAGGTVTYLPDTSYDTKRCSVRHHPPHRPPPHTTGAAGLFGQQETRDKRETRGHAIEIQGTSSIHFYMHINLFNPFRSHHFVLSNQINQQTLLGNSSTLYLHVHTVACSMYSSVSHRLHNNTKSHSQF